MDSAILLFCESDFESVKVSFGFESRLEVSLESNLESSSRESSLESLSLESSLESVSRESILEPVSLESVSLES